MTAIFKDFLANLAAVLRHIVPGCLALAFARLSHPTWFLQVDLSVASHLWILGIASLLIGNVVYVVHRTIVHQAIDWLVSGAWRRGYVDVVAKMIGTHFELPDEVRDSMHLRNSQIILTAILGEFSLIAWFWREPSSTAAEYSAAMLVLGIFAFVGAIVAHGISQHVARRLAK